MKKKSFFTPIVLLMLAAGCARQPVISVWKADPQHTIKYNKIAVISIVKNEPDSSRSARENEFTGRLKTLGYEAISAFAEFGQKGFAGLGEEATYLKLCEYGIDAVLTLARIEPSHKASVETGTKKYTSAYYYNHIWNYGKLETTNYPKQYIWEAILFDLVLLEPRFVGQTKPFDAQSVNETDAKLSEWMINKMKKEKIIFTQQ